MPAISRFVCPASRTKARNIASNSEIIVIGKRSSNTVPERTNGKIPRRENLNLFACTDFLVGQKIKEFHRDFITKPIRSRDRIKLYTV